MHKESEAHRLREMVKKIHLTDLLLLDGEGSLEKPFIIDSDVPLGDYLSVENDTIVYHFMYGGYASWQKMAQELIINENRTLDKITVKIYSLEGNGIVSSTRNMYFDITPFLGENKSEEENVDEKMKKMKYFIDRLSEDNS